MTTSVTIQMNKMKKFVLLLLVVYTVNSQAQTIGLQPTDKPSSSTGQVRTARKPVKKGTKTTAAKTPATIPGQNIVPRTIVYQYVDTTFPNSENHFPLQGNAGIGTPAPQAALEIKRSAGDTRKKNVLLQLSNQWSPNGQNEPSIMFSNGDISSIENVSYWTIGARVSGDNTLNTPQTFKICHKPIGSNVELEYFSVDSYQGKVKIGNVNSNVDGYKLFVEDGILTEKVKVAIKNSDDWFDNVFNSSYNLMSIYDLKSYINANHHLPEIPTTQEVMKDGVDLGKMNALLLKKIEELTKYMIDMQSQLDETKKELEETKKAVYKKN